jgi:hypothetical protein
MTARPPGRLAGAVPYATVSDPGGRGGASERPGSSGRPYRGGEPSRTDAAVEVVRRGGFQSPRRRGPPELQLLGPSRLSGPAYGPEGTAACTPGTTRRAKGVRRSFEGLRTPGATRPCRVAQALRGAASTHRAQGVQRAELPAGPDQHGRQAVTTSRTRPTTAELFLPQKMPHFVAKLGHPVTSRPLFRASGARFHRSIQGAVQLLPTTFPIPAQE